jgi:hypothetical protein
LAKITIERGEKKMGKHKHAETDKSPVPQEINEKALSNLHSSSAPEILKSDLVVPYLTLGRVSLRR